jgi:hypothetical protein
MGGGAAMNAPVCPVSRSQPMAAQPGVQLPAVPSATDLSSLIAAVNGLRNLLQNALGPGLPYFWSGRSIPAPVQPILVARTNWFETDRTTEDKRIYHTDTNGKVDKTMFVDVVRINRVVFQYLYDDPYGDTFTWNYKKPGQ